MKNSSVYEEGVAYNASNFTVNVLAIVNNSNIKPFFVE